MKRTGPWGFIGNINIWRGSKWLASETAIETICRTWEESK